MDNVLFESTEYKITQANFTYQGHSEPLGNITGLTIIDCIFPSEKVRTHRQKITQDGA